MRELAPRTFDDPGLKPLLDACFADLGTVAAGDDGAADAASLVEALAHLALIERGMLRAGSRLGQAALRTARLSQARRLIARHLQDPNLAPAMVADLLGVSVHHLHTLFESAARSFSQTVTDERLNQSRRLMREAPDRLIADIATLLRLRERRDLLPGLQRRLRDRARRLPRAGAGGALADVWAENRSRSHYLGENLRFFRAFPRPLH
ncbi:AraC-like DNA-binding protein [Bradyrhizobium sp. GM6.1]